MARSAVIPLGFRTKERDGKYNPYSPQSGEIVSDHHSFKEKVRVQR